MFGTLKHTYVRVVEADFGLKRTSVMMKAIPQSITTVDKKATYIILSKNVYVRKEP